MTSRLGQYLRTHRRRAKLSMQDVADTAGVSLTTIHRYEQGAIVPPADRSAALAEAYGVSLAALKPMIDAAWGRR